MLLDSNTKKEINRLNDLVNVLNNSIVNIKEKLEKEVNKWKNLFKKMCDEIYKVLGREKSKEYLEYYEDISDIINYSYYKYGKDNDDYEIGM